MTGDRTLRSNFDAYRTDIQLLKGSLDQIKTLYMEAVSKKNQSSVATANLLDINDNAVERDRNLVERVETLMQHLTTLKKQRADVVQELKLAVLSHGGRYSLLIHVVTKR